MANGTTAIHAQLQRQNIPAERIEHFTVPGAIEIPLHAQRLETLASLEGLPTLGA